MAALLENVRPVTPVNRLYDHFPNTLLLLSLWDMAIDPSVDHSSWFLIDELSLMSGDEESDAFTRPGSMSSEGEEYVGSCTFHFRRELEDPCLSLCRIFLEIPLENGPRKRPITRSFFNSLFEETIELPRDTTTKKVESS